MLQCSKIEGGRKFYMDGGGENLRGEEQKGKNLNLEKHHLSATPIPIFFDFSSPETPQKGGPLPWQKKQQWQAADPLSLLKPKQSRRPCMF